MIGSEDCSWTETFAWSNAAWLGLDENIDITPYFQNFHIIDGTISYTNVQDVGFPIEKFAITNRCPQADL